MRAGPCAVVGLIVLGSGTAPPAAASAALTTPAAAAPAAASTPAARYYTLDDFARVEKIDAHMHLYGPAERLMEQALADQFRVLTIVVDDPDYPPLREQRRDALALHQRYPGRVEFAITFSVDGFQAPGWSDAVLRDIDVAIAQGAVGLKIWKNIGLALRDADGRYVMPDDPRLGPVITQLEQRHLVLLGHQAEPRNCWLPFERMTVRSDREYFREHPQYYMYQHPEMPAHDAILAARDRMLRAHPGLRFDGVHLASLEWDVDRVADFLERFPTARVDVAARLVHLEYQAVRNRTRVRQFLIRYQDRVLYGSDERYGPDDSDPRAVADVHAAWLENWRFLATAQLMRSADFDGAFRGLQLPRAVIDKLYRRNALALFAGGWAPRAQTAGISPVRRAATDAAPR